MAVKQGKGFRDNGCFANDGCVPRHCFPFIIIPPKSNILSNFNFRFQDVDNTKFGGRCQAESLLFLCEDGEYQECPDMHRTCTRGPCKKTSNHNSEEDCDQSQTDNNDCGCDGDKSCGDRNCKSKTNRDNKGCKDKSCGRGRECRECLGNKREESQQDYSPEPAPRGGVRDKASSYRRPVEREHIPSRVERSPLREDVSDDVVVKKKSRR